MNINNFIYQLYSTGILSFIIMLIGFAILIHAQRRGRSRKDSIKK